MVTLEGVNAKLQRAQDQIEQLACDVTESCETLQGLFSEELRPDVGDRIWIFRGETPVVPIEYSVRLGEIVYNLRSSLEQLIWQLVHANYRAPIHRNEFPIFDDETRFNQAVATKLAGVSQETVTEIRGMQPFSKNDRWSALKTLHSLCNIDKHREVIFPFYTLDRCVVTYHGGGNPNIKPAIRTFSSIPVPELKSDEIACSMQPPDANVEVKLFVNMKLGGPGSFASKEYQDTNSSEREVILVLRDCISTVQAATDCLSPEIKRHPLFGRRPSFIGLRAIDYDYEHTPEFLHDYRDDFVRQVYKALGGESD